MIEHWDETIDGEINQEKMQAKLSRRGYTVNSYTYPPGTYFPNHTHKVDKIDCVLRDEFKISMQGESLLLKAGDCIAVPKGVIHNAEVIGVIPAVSLEAIKH